MKKTLALAIFAILTVLFSGFLPQSTPLDASARSDLSPGASETERGSLLREFGLVSSQDGWILLDQSLYWTDGSDGNWREITPPGLEKAVTHAIWFHGRQLGWQVSLEYDQAGNPTYSLARTRDGGVTWDRSRLSLFEPGEVDADAGALYLQFIDPQNGWMVVKRSTSSNFSQGTLFRTTDSGDTWTRLEIPIGEAVRFSSQDSGWVAGGAAGDELYHTQDGGSTWQAENIPTPTGLSSASLYFSTPRFKDPAHGILPVVVTHENQSRLDFLSTADGGITWNPLTSLPFEGLADPATPIPFDLTESLQLMVVHPESSQVYGVTGFGPSASILNQAETLPGIVDLQLADSNVGWAKQILGNCQPSISGTRECTSSTKLLRTSDGGHTWHEFALPPSQFQPTSEALSPDSQFLSLQNDRVINGALAPGTRTWITTGQGFDKCEIPTLDKLQTWAQNGPYAAVNLYIGGVARSCSNLALTASYLARLTGQGWKFIPTWVGPQAPCYSRPAAKMSSNPTTAYQQGISEADAAAAVATNLGLTLGDGSGAVIYYDLESYNTLDTTCHNAARAFVNGWSERMGALGLNAGLYGYGPAINDYATLSNPPEFIWPAHWIYSAYNPAATVWDVYGLSNTLWPDNARLRQYAGPHVDSWGGVSITVDSNVLDGAISSGPYEGDYDNDGYSDIYAVDKTTGVSGMSEVSILDGAVNFQVILDHLVTALPLTNNQWVFELGDYNYDGVGDLYAILKQGGQAGGIEAHILDGADGFQSFLLQESTALNPTWVQGWSFNLGDYDRDGIPDLFALDHANGASGYSEIHVLDGADGYQSFLLETPTALGNTGLDGTWAFSMGDYNGDGEIDLAAIDKSNGLSGNVEVHILSGADDYQTILLEGETGLPSITAGEGWAFFLRDHNLDGLPDLHAINKASGGSGLTEVHILNGADGFQSLLIGTASALPYTGADCNWDFLTGQCSLFTYAQPYSLFLPFIDR